MSFNITYELFRGDVLSVVGGKASESAVLIECSNFYVVNGIKKKESRTFKIACPDDLVALKVSEFIKNKFDHGETVSFSGTQPESGFVTVITPYDNFLSGVV